MERPTVYTAAAGRLPLHLARRAQRISWQAEDGRWQVPRTGFSKSIPTGNKQHCVFKQEEHSQVIGSTPHLINVGSSDL